MSTDQSRRLLHDLANHRPFVCQFASVSFWFIAGFKTTKHLHTDTARIARYMNSNCLDNWTCRSPLLFSPCWSAMFGSSAIYTGQFVRLLSHVPTLLLSLSIGYCSGFGTNISAPLICPLSFLNLRLLIPVSGMD